jgi:hypothetical protein
MNDGVCAICGETLHMEEGLIKFEGKEYCVECYTETPEYRMAGKSNTGDPLRDALTDLTEKNNTEATKGLLSKIEQRQRQIEQLQKDLIEKILENPTVQRYWIELRCAAEMFNNTEITFSANQNMLDMSNDLQQLKKCVNLLLAELHKL